jgi:hypothetical protein
MHGPGKITKKVCPDISDCCCHLPEGPCIHFHPARADGLYTRNPNAVVRQKVVVYDGKGRISPKDRNQGT